MNLIALISTFCILAKFRIPLIPFLILIAITGGIALIVWIIGSGDSGVNVSDASSAGGDKLLGGVLLVIIIVIILASVL